MVNQLSLPVETNGHRLSEAVYETLLEAILSGVLEPGRPISEIAIARQLDVSRTPVHEAIVQLVKDGLVRHEVKRRPVVAEFSADDVADLFDMRILLESESARRAAERIDRIALDQLRAGGDELAATLDDPRWVVRWADYDETFHEVIARASGSRRLANDIVRYGRLHRGINKLQNTMPGLQRALDEHFTILDALQARDPDRAADAMATHILEWKTYHVRLVSERSK